VKRVGIDCDGVICDFPAAVLAWAGAAYTRESITQHDMLKAWNEEHRQAELDAHCSQVGWCESLPVIEGAQAFVERLRRNFEVIVVTSPYSAVPTWTSERITWLQRHFGIPKRDVVFCKRKDLVHTHALVDDKIENLANFPGVRILVDHPWNRSAGPDVAVRAMTLEAAADELERWLLDGRAA
jgi:5'(3')-deoxyribonucleotidase